MTDSLLATQTNTTSEATTTQDGAADVDKQPVSEQQTQVESTDVAEPTEPTTTEPKTEPEKGEAKTEDKPAGAPERYAFEVPEGMAEGFELDSDVDTALADASRELDLTQEQAQQMLNKVWPVMHRRAVEQQNAIHEQWINDAKADKEYGGREFEKNKGTALKAVETFGTPGLQELLDGVIGSHPEMFRFLWKVGQAVSEDKFVGGNEGAQPNDPNDEAAVARRLYPNSP